MDVPVRPDNKIWKAPNEEVSDAEKRLKPNTKIKLISFSVY
jgi:hypothetical protein